MYTVPGQKICISRRWVIFPPLQGLIYLDDKYPACKLGTTDNIETKFTESIFKELQQLPWNVNNVAANMALSGNHRQNILSVSN